MSNILCIYHGNLSVVDAAYLAGLIDGEGSIAVSRTQTGAAAKACKRGHAYRASVTVTMTDLDLLKWAKRATGVGQICPKKVNVIKHRPAWTWSVWSTQAAALLEQLLPYLRIKKGQAENLIAFQGAMRRPGSKGLTDVEWAFREARYRQSQLFNRRGIAA